MGKFRQIPTAGRAIIVVCTLGVVGIALVACWTSYNAIYRLVSDMGLYGETTNTVFPLLLDAAFLVAELAAVLGIIMHRVTRSDEVSPVWPMVTMILCGVCTIAFNVAHAYLISEGGWADPMAKVRGAVSALPPVLMILSFQVLIAIVKWVMLRLGRPEQAFGGDGFAFGVPQMQNASVPRFQVGQSGRGVRSGGEAGGVTTTKREAVEGYLARLGSSAGILTAREIKEDLAEEGVNVSEQYVGRVMSGALSGRNGKGHA